MMKNSDRIPVSDVRYRKNTTLDYASVAINRPWIAWQSAASFVVLIIDLQFSTCMCGHIGKRGFLITLPMTLLAWWGADQKTSIAGRIAAWAIAILATGVFIKNIADVGWYGHYPLFR